MKTVPTLQSLPLLSVYTASKAAVNALTESIAFELEPFAVRVRLVLPGRAPETRCGDNARARTQDGFPDAYAELAQPAFAGMGQAACAVTHASDVADAVWRAATDPACPMRLPAGADAISGRRRIPMQASLPGPIPPPPSYQPGRLP